MSQITSWFKNLGKSKMVVDPDTSVPLVWTKYGNLPENELKLEVFWFIDSSVIKVVRRHTNAEGEIVKEGADVFLLKGLTGDTAVGKVS
jgi:hypothetical protein